MKVPVALFLLSVLVATVIAGCPNDCSGHGACHSGSICQCSSGWAGPDCSISDTELSSGSPVTGSLRSFSWNYYHINVAQGGTGLDIWVNQTSSRGDVDVFVQKDEYPTQRRYFQKDVTTERNVHMEVNVTSGIWYIGLYGYLSVQYTIEATVQLGCNVDCGSHGLCQNNACVCDAGYSGETCQDSDRTLTSGSPYSTSVSTGEWDYYNIAVPARHSVVVETRESSSASDCDLYVSITEPPSLFTYDASNLTSHEISTINEWYPSDVTLYIGVYGYNGGEYTITVTVGAVQCPNSCSNRGNCDSTSGFCSCSTGYSGSGCETMSSTLGVNQMESGFVDKGQWNYFKFQAITENDVVVNVTSQANQDCDVFVRADEDPTSTDYDYADRTLDIVTLVTIPDPSSTVWHVGVYGYSQCVYTLVIEEPANCQCVSNSHGTCPSGSNVCVCDSGYGGVDCATEATIMSSPQQRSDSVPGDAWKYYMVNATSAALIVSVLETESSGFLWVYVSLSGFPDLETFDAVNKETNTPLHEVHMVFNTDEARTYYIGVYNNPFDPNPSSLPFEISVYAPPF